MPLFDLSKIPAERPPPGVTPNFIDPPSQAYIPKIFTYVTFPPMIVFIALRLYARVVITHKLGLDDYLCLLAAATFTVYTVLLFTILDNPSGRHMWDVPASDVTVYYVRTSVITLLLFFVAALFAKTGILALYRRIFSPMRCANVLIISGMVFIVVFYIAMLVIVAVACTPQHADYARGGWLSPIYHQRCNRYNTGTTAASGIVGAVIDIYILVLPVFLVWELRTSTKRKTGLAAIFIVGSSACIFSIVSAYYRLDIVVNPRNDITWDTMPIYGWSIAEINVGILCSCIPVAFVLFRGMVEKSSTWSSQLWSKFTGGGSTKATDPSNSSKDPTKQPLHAQPNYDANLPQVPGATMTGLRSVLDKFGRSKAEKTQATGYRDDMDMTLMSVDYDYHRHLRAGPMDRRL